MPSVSSNRSNSKRGQPARLTGWLASLLLAASVLLAGCQSAPATRPQAPLAGVFRFALTFDDGPSIRPDYNPTLDILDQLARNDVQPGIKAAFFVQTHNANGGGSEAGQAIMRRMQADGHVLGLHSGDPRGHVGHLRLTPDALRQTLDDGKADIESITGRPTELVRPPYFAYSPETFAIYRAAGLRMMLTDVSANDGVIHIFNLSFRRRSHMQAELRRMRELAQRGELPAIGGVTPIVVTFHDPNPFTAEHFTEYLHILTDAARDAGLPLDATPFYDDTAALRAALLFKARSE